MTERIQKFKANWTR